MKALVLAGGVPQIELIKKLKNRNITVLLADYNFEPVAKPYADAFFQVSTLDVEAIKELALIEKVDFLITACTDQALLTVAQVSEMLGLPCYIDYKTALNVTNKSYMKEIFYKNDIPTAKYMIMKNLNIDTINKLSYPLIVKPVDCNSSKGVKKVYTLAELEKAFDEAVKFSRTKTAVVEEFIEGQEISVDVQVVNGKAYILSKSYSDKIAFDNKFVIYRARFPIVENDTVNNQIQQIAQQIADSFKLKNSPMLIQMISDKNQVYVLEFSARTGGGIKYELIRRVSGVDPINAIIDLTLEKFVEVKIEQLQSIYLTNVFIYCSNGQFDHLVGFEELKEEGIIEDYYIFKSQGTDVGNVTNSGDRVAGVTIQANSLESLQKKYGVFRENVKVIDVKGNDIMRHDLIDSLEY